MEFYNFFRWLLVITISTTLWWPLTVPLGALAYKVRHGANPVPLETASFWTRATFAALGLAVLALALALLASFITGGGFPPGVVYIVLFCVYFPVAAWFLFVMFALEDPFQGASVLTIWIALPGLLLGLLDLLGFDLPLQLARSWLAPITL